MKKKILSIAVIVFCLAILSGSTIAYFTAEDTARNVITSSGIRIDLVEQQLVDGVIVDYPKEKIPVMPGEAVSKIVSVKVLEEDAWIRICYKMTVLNAANEPIGAEPGELEALIQVSPDEEAWTYRDGWWYCNEAVSRGNSTAPLFEAVEFSGDMGNDYQECTVIIDVYAQAVQVANNGSSALEAAGWSGE